MEWLRRIFRSSSDKSKSEAETGLELTHSKKALGYTQNTLQLLGAGGVAISGLFEGNYGRTATYSINVLRSSWKIYSDTKSNSLEHNLKNELQESSVAAGINSAGYIIATSPNEEDAAVAGVAAWGMRAFNSTVFGNQNSHTQNQQETLDEFNKKIQNTELQNLMEIFPLEGGGKPSKENTASSAVLQATINTFKVAPSILMGDRAVSFVQAGIETQQHSMTAGGGLFLAAAILMFFKDELAHVRVKCKEKKKQTEINDIINHNATIMATCLDGEMCGLDTVSPRL